MRNIIFYISLFTFLLMSNISAQNVNKFDKRPEPKIYPNPLLLGQKLHIESDKAIVSVEVLDIIGKTIKFVDNQGYDSKEISFVLDQCKQGLYIVKISYQDKSFTINKLLVKSQ